MTISRFVYLVFANIPSILFKCAEIVEKGGKIVNATLQQPYGFFFDILPF